MVMLDSFFDLAPENHFPSAGKKYEDQVTIARLRLSAGGWAVAKTKQQRHPNIASAAGLLPASIRYCIMWKRIIYSTYIYIYILISYIPKTYIPTS